MNLKRRPTTTIPEDLPDKVAAAQADLKAMAEVSPRNVLAYSGGKDSLVVTHLARNSLGAREAVIDLSFTFPRFAAQARAIATDLGLSLVEYDRLSLAWLAAHPQFICGRTADQSRFYALRQQATIQRHAKEHGFTGVILGRRTQENTVPAKLYRKNNGLWQGCPIRDWKTEHVWAYLHQHSISVPDIYDYRLGQLEGATPWNTVSAEETRARHGLNHLELMYEYDPQVFPSMARIYPAAAAFLDERCSA